MRLEDEAVLLRPFEWGDVPAIVAACQDPEIPRWTSVPSPYTESDARAWLESTEEESFAVVDRSSGELLGSIGVRFPDEGIAEVGYWIGEGGARRRGGDASIGSRGGWVFENDEGGRFQLRADTESVASQRVAEKAGFVREGVMRAALALKGERRDVVMYSLVREDL